MKPWAKKPAGVLLFNACLCCTGNTNAPVQSLLFMIKGSLVCYLKTGVEKGPSQLNGKVKNADITIYQHRPLRNEGWLYVGVRGILLEQVVDTWTVSREVGGSFEIYKCLQVPRLGWVLSLLVKEWRLRKAHNEVRCSSKYFRS